MIARPSRPSVRFTALLKPTIKKYVTTIWNMPRGIARSLKYGINNEVCTSSVAVTYRATAAIMAAARLPEELLFRRDAGGVLQNEFLVIVDIADHAERQCDKQDDPDVHVLEVGPQQLC